MSEATGFATALRGVLAQIARDVLIVGPTLFRVADEAPEMALTRVTQYPNEALGDPLADSLAARLYARYYCRRRAPTERGRLASDITGALQQANASMDGWESGWELVSRDDSGSAVVRSGARTRLVEAHAHRVEDTTREGGAMRVALLRRREDLGLQSDYYYAYGEALGDHYEELVDARIYLNLEATAAQLWTGLLTREFNAYGVPFTLKLMRHAAAFRRIDTCVIYVPRRHAGFAVSVVVELARRHRGLRSPTPLFTRRIAAGIALADNPPGGASFGLSRMQWVAEAIVSAWRNGTCDPHARLQAIQARFRATGLDLRRPWLNPGNADVALAPVQCGKGARVSTRSPDWIDVAERIGRRLVRDAIWDGDQCTWLGWSVIPGSESGKPAVCTAGGDLYAGTSGIAIFLAQLARATQDLRFRGTALGALRHALARSQRGYWPVGAYSGLGGILHAALCVSSACDADEASALAMPLLERLGAARPMVLEVDIIEGRAGAIRALLHAARRTPGDNELALQTAARFGREILGLAVRDGARWSWATSLQGASHLLGYSHGTAGVACALHELFTATGERAFLDGADAALAYEWSGFDAAQNNWPDLRRHSRSAPEPGARRFMSAWCSGAPGTALALARRGPGAEDRAIGTHLAAALRTTLASLAPSAQSAAAPSFCLCHGTAGNCEILQQVHALTGDATLLDAVTAAARDGADRYHDTGAWPCGVPDGGESPSLLLGLAGIGHFYLRLHDPSIPSPLLL